MLKALLRDSFLTGGIYRYLKKERDKRRYRLATEVESQFIDRRKYADKLCLILAGYKPHLYEDVFERIGRYIPEDIDVCIVSSGLYSTALAEIAEKNTWSYLSTKRNCVTLAQNAAILLYKDAKYIYKIDEDIFVTRGCFHMLWQTMMRVEAMEPYRVGFVAPLIPVNGYGHLRILKKLGLTGAYKEKFERPIYASSSERLIEKSGDAARFFWGEGGYIPSIDQMNAQFSSEDFQYSVCPIRFSIGFILMRRDVWERMGMWKVLPDNPCMGVDEEQLCSFCMTNSLAIIVSENTVVGHLSFGQQNDSMKEYYTAHRERFKCSEE